MAMASIMKQFIILISGRGSNMRALLEAHRDGRLRAEPALVISNRSQAPGLETARALGVRVEFVSFKDAQADELRTIELAREVGAEFIVLAGFMRVLSPTLIDAFPDRIINIHPSLLPAFPGLHAQRQALDYGVRVSGCTTHFVNTGVDTGPIILQRVVEVKPDDTEETLSARILEQEHSLLIETVNLLADDRLQVVNTRSVNIRKN
jgi:phosphoribosylglycinamide formyltransferase 1